jgi:hypothetical protein
MNNSWLKITILMTHLTQIVPTTITPLMTLTPKKWVLEAIESHNPGS